MLDPVEETKEEKRARISRENGAKSRGPVTEEGKATSSRNRLSHGLYAASNLVIEGENSEDYELLRNDLYQQFQPRTAAEARAVEDIASAWWRMARAPRIEADIFRSSQKNGRFPVALFVNSSSEMLALNRQYTALDRSLANNIKRLELLRKLNQPSMDPLPPSDNERQPQPAVAGGEMPLGVVKYLLSGNPWCFSREDGGDPSGELVGNGNEGEPVVFACLEEPVVETAGIDIEPDEDSGGEKERLSDSWVASPDPFSCPEAGA